MSLTSNPGKLAEELAAEIVAAPDAREKLREALQAEFDKAPLKFLKSAVPESDGRAPVRIVVTHQPAPEAAAVAEPATAKPPGKSPAPRPRRPARKSAPPVNAAPQVRSKPRAAARRH